MICHSPVTVLYIFCFVIYHIVLVNEDYQYILSCNFMFVNFVPRHLGCQFHVRQIHVRHLQSTRDEA